MSAEHVDALPGGGSIGGFALRRAVGRGASATVYLACDCRNGRPVALKLLHAGPDATALAARAGEWAASSALEHPHIVQVLATGAAEERPWIAMEWVAGHDLSRYVDARLQLPDPVALDVARAVASALSHAHGRGIVHRDLKPANVRVHLPHGTVKLGDFGAASLHDGAATATGVLKGTPAYMAPEALAGAEVGPAADLYALGVVLYELLSGRRPHHADTLGMLLERVANEPPVALSELRPELPGALLALVDGLLQRDPLRRPGSADAVGDALARAAGELRAAVTRA